jgi:hypothetical protein
MSYSRSYSTVIGGTVSGSVSYPASQNGGSTSVTLQWQEPVDVTIYVDTDPFDDSVTSVKRHVDVLTGTVVATEAAQLAQKVHSAREISRTVTDGFFTLIASDITQQMAVVKSKIDSLLLALADLSQGIARIHSQMGLDYGRITERYSRVFEDLDKETQSRVSALDEALFRTRLAASSQADRPRGRQSSVVPTIFGGENSQSQAAVGAAGIRARMSHLLASASQFLGSDRKLTRAFREILTEDAGPGSPLVSVTVLYLKAEVPGGKTVEKVFSPEEEDSPLRQPAVQDYLMWHFNEESLPWSDLAKNPQVESHMNALVDGLESGDASHAARVRKMILALWAASKPAVLPC